MADIQQHLMDWTVNSENEKVFFILNSQECTSLALNDKSSETALNVVWGLVFLFLGVCVMILNLATIRGLFKTTSRLGEEIFQPAIYVNVSILNIMTGLCTILSGAIMLSNFTWDDDNSEGKFVCNLFGILFMLAVQTKVLLISFGLFVTVLGVVFNIKPSPHSAMRVAAGVVVLSWVFGAIQALLPYFYGSRYTQPDYLATCTASFAYMDHTQTESYYAGHAVMMFIPLFLGLSICFFTLPGLIFSRRNMKVYNWNDGSLGVFTMSSLFCSFVICNASYFFVQLTGLGELDENQLVNWCALDLYSMRYFFAFMLFTMYLSGIAEPLCFMTCNLDVRERVCGWCPGSEDSIDALASNRVTPMMLDIRRREDAAGASEV